MQMMSVVFNKLPDIPVLYLLLHTKKKIKHHLREQQVAFHVPTEFSSKHYPENFLFPEIDYIYLMFLENIVHLVP